MRKSSVFSLLYAFGNRFYISLVGQLMLAELFAFVLLPFIGLRKIFIDFRELKVVIYGLVLLLLSLIVSDLFNKSDPVDFLRGWAVIIFGIISTIFLTKQFSSNSKAVIYFLFGLFLVKLFFGEGLLNIDIQEENSNYFKVRFVGFLNPAILITSYIFFRYNLKKSSIFLFLFYGIFCFAFDARSTGLIFLLSFILLYIKLSGIFLSKLKIYFGSFFLVLVLYISYLFYVDQVLNYGFGGSNAEIQLSASENPYNPFDLLYNGRKEVFVSFYAIFDKPIIGHGSWAKDVGGKYGNLLTLLSDSNADYGKDFIPSHSIIFSAWLYAGVFGFLFLGYVFFVLFKFVFFYFRFGSFEALTPVLILISIEMAWHMVFSPFGHLRISFPFFAALVISHFSLIKNKQLIFK